MIVYFNLSIASASWCLKKVATQQINELNIKRTADFFDMNSKIVNGDYSYLWAHTFRLVFLNPVGVQKRTVSHLRGLFKIFKMRYSTFLYSYWIGLHVHFKKAILHLKRATVPLYLSICVIIPRGNCNSTPRLETRHFKKPRFPMFYT